MQLWLKEAKKVAVSDIFLPFLRLHVIEKRSNGPFHSRDWLFFSLRRIFRLTPIVSGIISGNPSKREIRLWCQRTPPARTPACPYRLSEKGMGDCKEGDGWNQVMQLAFVLAKNEPVYVEAANGVVLVENLEVFVVWLTAKKLNREIYYLRLWSKVNSHEKLFLQLGSQVSQVFSGLFTDNCNVV